MDNNWIELDVRPILAAGKEPCSIIMNQINALGAGQGLLLSAPFYPRPLVERLEREGWSVRAEEMGQAHWQVRIEGAGRQLAGSCSH